MPVDAEAKVEFICGRLLRKRAEGGMRRLAFLFNLQLDLREIKGWLESSFYGKLRGSKEDLAAFRKAWKQQLEQFEY